MSLIFYTLDLAGNPQEAQTIEEWVHWAQNHTHDRVVLKTKCGDTWVVTIFLAIDFGREAFDVETLVEEPALPLLYETMVFGGKRPGFSRKFPTRTQAIDFHHALENMVREAEEEYEDIVIGDLV
jgi:hypothetical protein